MAAGGGVDVHVWVDQPTLTCDCSSRAVAGGAPKKESHQAAAANQPNQRDLSGGEHILPEPALEADPDPPSHDACLLLGMNVM